MYALEKLPVWSPTLFLWYLLKQQGISGLMIPTIHFRCRSTWMHIALRVNSSNTCFFGYGRVVDMLDLIKRCAP